MNHERIWRFLLGTKTEVYFLNNGLVKKWLPFAFLFPILFSTETEIRRVPLPLRSTISPFPSRGGPVHTSIRTNKSILFFANVAIEGGHGFVSRNWCSGAAHLF